MQNPFAVLALLLGFVPLIYAGPPLIVPAVEVQAPDLQHAPVVCVYFTVHRSQSLPALLLIVRATASRSAWCIQYAYGDLERHRGRMNGALFDGSARSFTRNDAINAVNDPRSVQ